MMVNNKFVENFWNATIREKQTNKQMRGILLSR